MHVRGDYRKIKIESFVDFSINLKTSAFVSYPITLI
jgi:hypothetical protein